MQSPCLGLLHPSSRQCKGKIFTPATTTVAIVCGDGDIVSVIRAAAIVCGEAKKEADILNLRKRDSTESGVTILGQFARNNPPSRCCSATKSVQFVLLQ